MWCRLSRSFAENAKRGPNYWARLKACGLGVDLCDEMGEAMDQVRTVADQCSGAVHFWLDLGAIISAIGRLSDSCCASINRLPCIHFVVYRECREKAESSTVRTGFVSELERCWPSAWLIHVTDSLLKMRTRSVAVFCGRAKTWVSSLARVRKLGGLTSTWPGFGSVKALLVRQGALWPSLAQWRSKTVHVGSRLGRWSRSLMTLKASWCEVAWLPCAMVAIRINAAELRRIGAERCDVV
nr:hypothetical protein Iba_chr12aCG8670 [Ipomoea batatas]